MLARRITRTALAVALAFAGVGTVGGGSALAGGNTCGSNAGGSNAAWLRYDEPVMVEEAPAPGNGSNQLLIAGLGAITGVVAFNLATGGTAALPFFASTTAGTVSAAEGAVAVSRVYAVTSAVVGALTADWLYRNSQEQRIRPVPRRLAARLAM
ncbi:MAG: hypothetical protein H7840_13135 [Alphaproteobacteria bacterium]